MSSGFKLVYLNSRGRGELTRYILAQAGQKYEDCRIALEKWSEFRSTTPLGIVPTLEFDGGVVISGNANIAAYLSEKFGLSGDTPEGRAEAGSIVEAVEESWQRVIDFFWEQDQGRKEQLRTLLMTSHLPLALTKLEKICAVNGRPEGWIVGTKVTYADFAVCVFLEAICAQKPDLLNNFPCLMKLKNSVENLPRIKAWLDERPSTPF